MNGGHAGSRRARRRAGAPWISSTVTRRLRGRSPRGARRRPPRAPTPARRLDEHDVARAEDRGGGARSRPRGRAAGGSGRRSRPAASGARRRSRPRPRRRPRARRRPRPPPRPTARWPAVVQLAQLAASRPGRRRGRPGSVASSSSAATHRRRRRVVGVVEDRDAAAPRRAPPRCAAAVPRGRQPGRDLRRRSARRRARRRRRRARSATACRPSAAISTRTRLGARDARDEVEGHPGRAARPSTVRGRDVGVRREAVGDDAGARPPAERADAAGRRR